MDLTSLKAEDFEKAFVDFYKVMSNSEHFRVFFDSQDQIDLLIKSQANNLYQSLTMSDADFQENYVNLGLMHAKMKLPFEDMVSALTMIRDNLLKNTSIKSSLIYSLIERMERYLAKGYLNYQFDDVIEQLDLSIKNVEGSYVDVDYEVVLRPLNWLKAIVIGFQSDRVIKHEDILTADQCPLTLMILELDVETELQQHILISHSEQHSLALSMAFFFREEDFMLASFMFSKLFAITVSLSNQIGLAVSQQAIEELHYDALTGLLMRRSLDSKVAYELNRLQAARQSAAVMLLDIDHFKTINDTWGHPAGDKVLKITGELLKSNQREHDLAFRYGGEEFLVLVSNVSFDNASTVAERLRQQVESLTIEWEGESIPVTLSIGCVVMSADAEDRSIMNTIEKADQNLYTAKKSGRNQVVINQLKDKALTD